MTATLGPEALGAELGERATLVQFSTAFCQPCRATRRTLAEVAAMVPGVGHVEIDAEERLDLVRELGIDRTPPSSSSTGPEPSSAGPRGSRGRRTSSPRWGARSDVVTLLPHAGTHLTARGNDRHPGGVPPELLLYGRTHVDLARNASARCPGV